MCRARGFSSERAHPLHPALALVAPPVQQQHLHLVLLQVQLCFGFVTPLCLVGVHQSLRVCNHQKLS